MTDAICILHHEVTSSFYLADTRSSYAQIASESEERQEKPDHGAILLSRVEIHNALTLSILNANPWICFSIENIWLTTYKIV